MPIHRLRNSLCCLCHSNARTTGRQKHKRKTVCYVHCIFLFIYLCVFALFCDYIDAIAGSVKTCVNLCVFVCVRVYKVLPVTITVRMCALWRSCNTAGVSAFSLFCMMIRPRNSMFASMCSLIQRKTYTAAFVCQEQNT